MTDAPPNFAVTIQPTGETFRCSVGESLLRGMLRLGRRDIPVGCTNGGCGVCKIRVVAGRVVALGPVSRQHVSREEEEAGLTLACRAGPAEPVHVEVIGRLAKRFSELSKCK